MESIDLSELKNYNAELVEEFLAPLAGQRLEITFAKEQDLSDFYPPEDLTIHYAGFHIYREAAYIGQQLALASESFAYYVPCPTLMEPFRFIVDCRNIPALTKALTYIIDGHFFDDMIIWDDFHWKAEDFYIAVVHKKETCYTQGLIQVASDFFNGEFSVGTDGDEEDE